jgi:hypothetical protein
MNPAARLALEAMMAQGMYEYQRDYARRYFGEGKAEAVLSVLAAHGIAVGEALRERILACHDLPLLDAWLARAVTAATAAEVVALETCAE